MVDNLAPLPAQCDCYRRATQTSHRTRQKLGGKDEDRPSRRSAANGGGWSRIVRVRPVPVPESCSAWVTVDIVCAGQLA